MIAPIGVGHSYRVGVASTRGSPPWSEHGATGRAREWAVRGAPLLPSACQASNLQVSACLEVIPRSRLKESADDPLSRTQRPSPLANYPQRRRLRSRGRDRRAGEHYRRLACAAEQPRAQGKARYGRRGRLRDINRHLRLRTRWGRQSTTGDGKPRADAPVVNDAEKAGATIIVKTSTTTASRPTNPTATLNPAQPTPHGPVGFVIGPAAASLPAMIPLPLGTQEPAASVLLPPHSVARRRSSRPNRLLPTIVVKCFS